MEKLGKTQEKEMHLRDYLDVIIRRKWIVLSFMTVAVVTTMIRTLSIKPTFQATCQVLIERSAPKVLQVEEVLGLDATWGYEYYQTQYEILKSNLLAQRVIKELKLDDHPDFTGGHKPLLNSTAEASQPPKIETRLINTYLSRLSITPIADSRLVNINFESFDPELAAQIANAHARNYIDHSWERRFDTTQDAIKWLKKQIKETRKKLESSEEELQLYRKKNDLVYLDFDEKQNIILQKLSTLSNTLTEAKTARIGKENLHQELKKISKNPGMIESIPVILNNSLIQSLKTQHVEMESVHSELSQKYGPEHPRMIQLKSQIREIRNEIAREIKKISRSIESECRVALAREKSLQKALTEQKEEALDLNRKEIQYTLIKRDVETNHSVYDSLLERLNETTLTDKLEVTNINVVAPAVVPNSPAKPNRKRALILAMVVSLMGGLGLAFFFEYFDRSVKSSEDIEEKLGMLSLGYVETLESPSSERLITLHDQKSIITEELRTIASNLLFSIPDRPNKVILITSALPQEGKTFMATNLSVVLAGMGKRVLLVDVDMRNPTVSTVFKIKKSPGLSDFLAHGKKLPLHVQHTSVRDIGIISAGTSVPNPAELLISQKMASFINRMREKDVFIILDAPPIMMLSDTLNIAPLVDGVVMVAKSGVTPCATIKKAVQQLTQINAKLVGVVLNKHNISREGYYNRYYYRDYHYYLKGDKRAREKTV